MPKKSSKPVQAKKSKKSIVKIIIDNTGSETVVASTISLEFFRMGETIAKSFTRIHKKLFKLGGY